MVGGGGIGVEDFAVPKGVVGEDESAGAEEGQEEFVVVAVEAFVGVDEGEVEWGGEGGDDVEGVADVKGDFVAVRGGGELAADEGLLFVVDFDGVQFAVGG